MGEVEAIQLSKQSNRFNDSLFTYANLRPIVTALLKLRYLGAEVDWSDSLLVSRIVAHEMLQQSMRHLSDEHNLDAFLLAESKMDFEEFLLANGEDMLCQTLAKRDFDQIRPLRTRFIEQLRQYYYVGGMPEAVRVFVEERDVMEVRRIQQALVEAYLYDISKHAPTNEVKRITQMFRSIPSQLARENKKFIYGAVKKGGRAAEFEVAIQWLVDCGIVHKILRITKAALPLSFYEDLSAFKLYLHDCGLLGCMAGVPASQMFIGDNAFTEFKGAFTEQYVLQQLKCDAGNLIYYFSNDTSTLEIEFVV